MDVDADDDTDILHQNSVQLVSINNPEYNGRQGIDRQIWFIYENLSENGVLKFRVHKDIFQIADDGTGRFDQYGLFVDDIARIDINGDGLLDFMYSGSG